MDPRSITRAESVGASALWFGLLGGPMAWVVQMGVNYMLEEVISCTPGSTTGGEILGASVTTIALAVGLALTLVAGASAAVAVSRLRAAPDGDDGSARRARWMARAGVMNGVLFTIVIAAGLISPLLLDPCRYSP